MAARVVLFCLLLPISLAAGLLEEEQDSPSKRQQVSPRLGSTDDLFKDLENPLQTAQGGVTRLPDAALRQNDRKPNDFDFKDDAARRSAAKLLTPRHSPKVGGKQEKGEVEGVISSLSLVPSSEGQIALRPESRWDGSSARVTGSGDGRVGPRARRRRSWLWNQFFVIEEYRGPEPVLIGRVSFCPVETLNGVIILVPFLRELWDVLNHLCNRTTRILQRGKGISFVELQLRLM